MTFHLPIESRTPQQYNRNASIINDLGGNDEEFHDFLQSARFDQFSGGYYTTSYSMAYS